MKKAFTIIELVIAMIIFWIGILVVLNALNYNASLLQKVKITTTATLIAKDQIATFYNFRDSNNIKYKAWNLITGSQFFEAGKSYKVWTELSGNKNMIEEISHPNFLTARLYEASWAILTPTNIEVYTWTYLTYKNTWKKTPYARWINLKKAYLAPEWSYQNKDIFKLESVVKYRWSWTSWQVVLESFVTNWR